jgi:hypothetical protein
MAKFITTIELQDAEEKDYDSLYKELKKESFKSEEHAGKSKAYITEKGAFSKEGKVTLQEVTDTVLKAVSKIGKKYSFFVIKDKHLADSNF